MFDRPELTKRVLHSIAEARPRDLFIFADGPRSPEEAELCAQAREITQRVDWDCNVHYNFSDSNMGTRHRMASGISWVFSQVEEAIILEDDCIPHPSFFVFCEEMLERYRTDERVLMVSGANYLERWKQDRQSYHFSHFGATYGWATWRRAWRYYDVNMAAWADAEVKARVRDLLADEEVFAFQASRFDRRYADTDGKKSWDIPWIFGRLAQAGLAVVPAGNLVTNVGNVPGRGNPPDHPLSNLRISPMSFPLRPPSCIGVDREYDRLHVRRIYKWWDLQRQAPSRALHQRLARKLRYFSGHFVGSQKRQDAPGG
jgi:hypothetical protein